ncbi:CDK5 regulatory subunit-associated protein 3 [Cyclospora cayetanensis]|uniref:CDK5 regulatory subunit-associated protein 3 n=1 Tax=Cyclospora cayetanensis TaxID=88456 RepID=A0A6P6RX33_9EIME|nr:CDK5 regulatory subunit-associated protein 3 [Cyclospora cayetanensis]
MEDVADVPYEGVVGWLLCRRLLPEDYHQRLKGMTAHVNAALETPPESQEAAKLIAEKKGGPFGYREVEELVQILMKEGGSEGLFSKAFGSAMYRQWRRLQRTFQQQNLHLADLSRALTKTANMLVPTQQKILQQKQRLLSDCIKKQQLLKQSAASSQEAYVQLCLKYGLEEAAATDPLLLQQQLFEYVNRELPLRLRRAEALIRQQGAELLAFYRSFVAFSTSENTSKEARNDSLPLLALLSEMGNVLLAEAAAAAPEIPVLQQQVQDDTAAAAVQIEIQQQGDEGGLSDLDDLPADHTCWIVEEGEGTWNGSSATDSSSNITDSLLGSAAVRRQLLLELTELRGFLYARIVQNPAAAASSSKKQQLRQQWQQHNVLPEELQKSHDTLLRLRDSLEELHELLGGAETVQLLQLLQNERARNKVLNELMAARAQAQKPLSAAKEQQRREASLSSEMEAAAALLDKQRGELQQLVKLLHERMATAVNRKVRITGIPRDRLP